MLPSFWKFWRILFHPCLSFFVVALTALILSRDAVLVSCAFYFRYKSLPSPVSLVDCDRYRKLNHSNEIRCVAALISLQFYLLLQCSNCSYNIIVLGLETLFQYVVCFIVLSKFNQAIYVRPCELLPEALKMYSCCSKLTLEIIV